MTNLMNIRYYYYVEETYALIQYKYRVRYVGRLGVIKI